jgi:NDP-sugar pyrophosphorylase family protein
MSGLHVIIPLAGEGKRFKEVGYTDAKPFIDVAGKSMIHRVICNLPLCERLVFIARSEHKKRLEKELDLIGIHNCADHYSIVTVDELTEGAACTVLKAKDIIPEDALFVFATRHQTLDQYLRLLCHHQLLFLSYICTHTYFLSRVW